MQNILYLEMILMSIVELAAYLIVGSFLLCIGLHVYAAVVYLFERDRWKEWEEWD